MSAVSSEALSGYSRAGRPDSARVAVIPDAWFQLTAVGRDPVSIALELDRGTEGQKHWRRKVAALTAWGLGPYQGALEADNLTVAVVVPTTARRMQLSDWTRWELSAIGQSDFADIFLFTEASPVATDPVELFLGPLWYPAGQNHPVSLLDAPAQTPTSDVSAVHAASVQDEPAERVSPPDVTWALMEDEGEVDPEPE
ncbi:hypothetical protein ABZ769_11020 [Streptomyces olivoreticuli]